jgi:hypothetical protein
LKLVFFGFLVSTVVHLIIAGPPPLDPDGLAWPTRPDVIAAQVLLAVFVHALGAARNHQMKSEGWPLLFLGVQVSAVVLGMWSLVFTFSIFTIFIAPFLIAPFIAAWLVLVVVRWVFQWTSLSERILKLGLANQGKLTMVYIALVIAARIVMSDAMRRFGRY